MMNVVRVYGNEADARRKNPKRREGIRQHGKSTPLGNWQETRGSD